LDILAGHHFALRGQSRRQLGLADLSLVELAEQEGPQQAFALVTLLDAGKTNKVGRKEFMGSMRHKEPILCSHGALAQYLYHRFHVSGEPEPCFKARQDWYDIKLLVTTATSEKATEKRTGAGRKKTLLKANGEKWQWNETELAYLTQARDIWSIFQDAGVSSAEITHAMRGCAARAASLHNVPDVQVSFLIY
jgi:hypothetical protein